VSEPCSKGTVCIHTSGLNLPMPGGGVGSGHGMPQTSNWQQEPS
jgi:hypothetical protein